MNIYKTNNKCLLITNNLKLPPNLIIHTEKNKNIMDTKVSVPGIPINEINWEELHRVLNELCFWLLTEKRDNTLKIPIKKDINIIIKLLESDFSKPISNITVIKSLKKINSIENLINRIYLIYNSKKINENNITKLDPNLIFRKNIEEEYILNYIFEYFSRKKYYNTTIKFPSYSAQDVRYMLLKYIQKYTKVFI